MVKSCCDSYHTQFSDFSAMLSYHEQVRKSSLWERTEVKKLQVAALDKTSPLYEDTDSFDPSVSRDAVEDTAENLKLAIKLRDKFFPLRDTAYKSLRREGVRSPLRRQPGLLRAGDRPVAGRAPEQDG